MNFSSIRRQHACLRSVCTVVLLAGFSLFATAQQTYDPEKVPKKAQDLYQKAYERSKDEGYDAAIKILKDAVKIDPRFADAWLTIAGMYSEQKKYSEAIENYEKAREIDSVYFKDWNLPYSINLAGMGQFE